jgi:hypothetical protein
MGDYPKSPLSCQLSIGGFDEYLLAWIMIKCLQISLNLIVGS